MKKSNHSQKRPGEQNRTKPDTLPEKSPIKKENEGRQTDEVSGQDDLSGLSERQRQAFPFLISARSLEAGCVEAGISRTTYYEWAKDEAFRAEIDRLRSEIISDALDRLKRGVSRAVDRLLELVNSDKEHIAFIASVRTIEFFVKMKETEELEKRIEALEQVVKASEQKEKGGKWEHDFQS